MNANYGKVDQPRRKAGRNYADTSGACNEYRGGNRRHEVSRRAGNDETSLCLISKAHRCQAGYKIAPVLPAFDLFRA